jgi:hypothetical protein
MKRKYDWEFIQREYDSGLTQGQLQLSYGVSPRAFQKAIARGDFKSRDRSSAATMSNLTKQPVKHTDEFKEKQRDRIIARYEAGWMPKSGRCKKYRYTSTIAGEVLLDGTWELAVAKWLDQNQYTWKRNTKRFQYIRLDGKISHYTPDFWVKELNGYLEVKGYETTLDRCKWSQFNEPLTVWKRKELTEMKII